MNIFGKPQKEWDPFKGETPKGEPPPTPTGHKLSSSTNLCGCCGAEPHVGWPDRELGAYVCQDCAKAGEIARANLAKRETWPCAPLSFDRQVEYRPLVA